MSVTITLNALSNAIEIVVANSGTPDRNEVWRQGTDEASAVRLTKTLGVDDTYTDYGVASGITYSYFVREVASGVETQSTTASLSITLTECWLHALEKQADTQLSGGLISIPNQPGQSRGPGRPMTSYRCGGRDAQVVDTGDATEQVIGVLARFRDAADLDILQTIFESNRALCFRDQKGLKVFVGLQEIETQYAGGFFADVPLALMEIDYQEHVD